MRTTIIFEDDVAAAIDRLRRERDAGVSEVVNHLVRRGLAAPSPSEQPEFVQESSPMGPRIDVSDVADALETLDGPSGR